MSAGWTPLIVHPDGYTVHGSFSPDGILTAVDAHWHDESKRDGRNLADVVRVWVEARYDRAGERIGNE